MVTKRIVALDVCPFRGVRNWPQHDPESADGTMPLADYVTLFSTGLFRERLQPDYLLRLPQFLPQWMATLAEAGQGRGLLAAGRQVGTQREAAGAMAL